MAAATPSRASFAGQTRQSPSFRDIARQFIPSDREKTFKQAVTQAAANLILLSIIVICYAIHVVLLPFLRPLLLALLFGSFLYPLKRSLSLFFKSLINQIREDENPLLAGLFMPFKIIDDAITVIQDCAIHYAQVIHSFSLTFITFDLSSLGVLIMVALSMIIIGGDRYMNLLICVNLIIFFTQISKTDVSFSDAYLFFLIRSFALTQFYWLSPQIIYILVPILTLLLVMKWIFLKIKDYTLSSFLDEPTDDGQDRRRSIPDSLTDTPPNHDVGDEVVNSLYDHAINLSTTILDFLEGYVDAISTLCVILLIFLIVLFTTIYLSFQIYAEAVYLVDRLSTSINTVVENNPDLKQMLPEGITGVQGLLDGAVNNTYQHGREWIMKSTRQLLNNAALEDFNTTQSNLIEKQMVEFWDRAYVLWLKNRNGTSDLNDSNSPYDWNRLFEALQTLDLPLCVEIFKQNWATLVSVIDSLTKVLKGNLSLVLGFITALLSFLIDGGNAVANFIFSLIIFTTFLFNLLCASGTQYKPIELIKKYTPPARTASLLKRRKNHDNNELWSYVDESINTVFTASLKIMAFQGLSTWLLHILFRSEVVYIPSVISMIFGALPFISPYWASVPAIIDLCWSEHWSQGLLMFVFATIPSSFVTSTFYSEIKGAGDPYLTGLAIAGGVFVFGIEGALFGPMLLVSMKLLYLIVVDYTDIYS